ncbi:MAG TPA: methyl-accepting chemotaxis protein [Baekduia sp.]
MKLLGSAGLLVALMVVLSVLAVSALSNTADQSAHDYDHTTEPLASLGLARATANDTRALVIASILETTDAARLEQVAAVKKDETVIQQELAKVKAMLDTDATEQDYTTLETDWEAYKIKRDRALDLAGSATQKVAWAYENDTATPAFAKVEKDFADLFDSEVSLAATGAKQVHDTYRSSRTLMIVMTLIAAIVGFGIAAMISTGIRRNVKQVLDRLTSLRERDTTDLRGAMDRMAAGDLTVEVTPVTPLIERWSNDELGDVAQAVNTVRENTFASVEAYNTSRESLAAMIGQVAGTASTVSSASQQIAATSDEAGRAVGEIAGAIGEVAAGSEKQVAGIADVRRLTEEASEATTRSAQDASDTAKVAEEARQIATEGALAVDEATEAMASVRTASEQATQAIRALGQKSDQIGGIVATITGIAEQTNLLALNAAIEAARAGEQGRGFAVVAEEVRKLAEESQTAARSISSLIGEIQEETGRAVEVVEDGSVRTEQGAATVELARDAFKRIGGSVEDVTTRVGQIAASVQQMAAAAQQTGERISDVAAVAEQASASAEQVSASTEETSASTEEIAASAQELARTAADLEQLVGQFTLR